MCSSDLPGLLHGRANVLTDANGSRLVIGSQTTGNITVIWDSEV